MEDTPEQAWLKERRQNIDKALKEHFGNKKTAADGAAAASAVKLSQQEDKTNDPEDSQPSSPSPPAPPPKPALSPSTQDRDQGEEGPAR